MVTNTGLVTMVGVPLITPVVAFKTNPVGNVISDVYPVTAPPVLVGLNGVITVP